VILILLYGSIFGGALWMLRARSPLFNRPKAKAPAAGHSTAADRDAVIPRSSLLSGEGLSPVARDEYFRGLSTQCCTCGCEMNLRDCLVTDQSCAKSPEMAGALMEQVR
jgi:hypothetical protein